MTTTYKGLNISNEKLEELSSLLNHADKSCVELELSKLHGTYSLMLAQDNLKPTQERKALKAILNKIGSHLNKGTQGTAKRLTDALNDYEKNFGCHRKWLRRSITDLVDKHKADPMGEERLKLHIDLLYRQGKGAKENAYLINELIRLYEVLSSRPAVTISGNKVRPERDYKQCLAFLNAVCPLFTGLNLSHETLRKKLETLEPSKSA